jgi:hypothetical protein
MLNMRIPASLIGLALPLSGLLLLPVRSSAQSFNFVQIDVPCGACAGGIALSTSVQAINAAGDIVGSYTDTTGSHGFVLSKGILTSIDVPGALMGVGGTLPTGATGISPSGDMIAGSFTAPVSSAPFGSPAYCPAPNAFPCSKGFLYSRGKFVTLLFPLASPSGGYHLGSVPQRITPDGDIYGCFHDDTGLSMFGAVWSRLGDISLAAGGGELGASDPLAATGVPNSMNHGGTPGGQTVVGHWTDAANHTHGYIVRNGEFHSFDVPGSSSTSINDINPGGLFVGVYRTDKNHGFVQLPDESSPMTLDFPSALPPRGTAANSINAGGAIVGQYTDSSGHLHGFLAVPSALN